MVTESSTVLVSSPPSPSLPSTSTSFTAAVPTTTSSGADIETDRDFDQLISTVSSIIQTPRGRPVASKGKNSFYFL